MIARRLPRLPRKLRPDHLPRPEGSIMGFPVLRVAHLPVVAVKVPPGWNPVRRAVGPGGSWLNEHALRAAPKCAMIGCFSFCWIGM
jgi:hypothetical protein